MGSAKNGVTDEELTQIVGQVGRIEELVRKQKLHAKPKPNSALSAHAAEHKAAMKAADEHFHVQSLAQITGEHQIAAAKSATKEKLDELTVQSGGTSMTISNPL